MECNYGSALPVFVNSTAEDVYIRPYRISAIIEIVMYMLLHEVLHEYSNTNSAGSSVVIAYQICPVGNITVTLDRVISRKHVEMLQGREPYNTPAIRLPSSANGHSNSSGKVLYSMGASNHSAARSPKMGTVSGESAIASSSVMREFYGFIGSTLLMPINFMQNMLSPDQGETPIEHGVFGRLAARLALSHLQSDITIVETNTVICGDSTTTTGSNVNTSGQDPLVKYQYSFTIPFGMTVQPQSQSQSEYPDIDNQSPPDSQKGNGKDPDPIHIHSSSSSSSGMHSGDLRPGEDKVVVDSRSEEPSRSVSASASGSVELDRDRDGAASSIVNMDIIMRNDLLNPRDPRDGVSVVTQDRGASSGASGASGVPESSVGSERDRDRRDAPLNIVSVVSFEEQNAFDYQWVFIENAKMLPRRSSSLSSSVGGTGNGNTGQNQNSSYHYCNNTTDPYSSVKQNLARLQMPFMTCHIGDIHRVLIKSYQNSSKRPQKHRQRGGDGDRDRNDGTNGKHNQGMRGVNRLHEDDCEDIGRILLVKETLTKDAVVVAFLNEIADIPNITVIYVYDTERVSCRDVLHGYLFPVSLCLSRHMDITDFFVLAIKTILQLQPRVMTEGEAKCTAGESLE